MNTSRRRRVLALRPWGSVTGMICIMSGPGRHGVGPGKFAFAFQDHEGDFRVDVMGMDRQFLAGLEVEGQDPQVGRIVEEFPMHLAGCELVNSFRSMTFISLLRPWAEGPLHPFPG